MLDVLQRIARKIGNADGERIRHQRRPTRSNNGNCTMTRRHLLSLLSAFGLGARVAEAAGPSAAADIVPLRLSDAQWQQRLSPAGLRTCCARKAPSARHEPAQRREAQGHASLRRLRPAAVQVGAQVRQRHRLAELPPR